MIAKQHTTHHEIRRTFEKHKRENLNEEKKKTQDNECYLEKSTSSMYSGKDARFVIFTRARAIALLKTKHHISKFKRNVLYFVRTWMRVKQNRHAMFVDVIDSPNSHQPTSQHHLIIMFENVIQNNDKLVLRRAWSALISRFVADKSFNTVRKFAFIIREYRKKETNEKNNCSIENRLQECRQTMRFRAISSLQQFSISVQTKRKSNRNEKNWKELFFLLQIHDIRARRRVWTMATIHSPIIQ